MTSSLNRNSRPDARHRSRQTRHLSRPFDAIAPRQPLTAQGDLLVPSRPLHEVFNAIDGRLLTAIHLRAGSSAGLDRAAREPLAENARRGFAALAAPTRYLRPVFLRDYSCVRPGTTNAVQFAHCLCLVRRHHSIG